MKHPDIRPGHVNILHDIPWHATKYMVVVWVNSDRARRIQENPRWMQGLSKATADAASLYLSSLDPECAWSAAK